MNSKGEAPLHVAAVSGNIPVLQYLVSVGATANVQAATGDTPLMYAVRARKPIACAVLVQANSNLALSGPGGSALEIARKMEVVQILEILECNSHCVCVRTRVCVCVYSVCFSCLAWRCNSCAVFASA